MSKLATNHEVQDLVSEIKKGISQIHSSEEWKAWLAFGARFWNYSFGNQMLIALQRPRATRVAGFYTWREFGRSIKKGEHGIRILAPLIAKVKVEKKGSEEDQTISALKGFKVVTVFDVSQTHGEELPALDCGLHGLAPAGIFESLKTFIEGKGYPVRFEELEAGLHGYVNWKKEIVLKAGVSEAQTLDTLAHETAHALLGHVGTNKPHDEKELEAETAAWIVCTNTGLPTWKSSFKYLATWAKGPDWGEKLEKAAARACEVAREILTGLPVVDKASISVGGK
jgi:antirestriction protein ArdC